MPADYVNKLARMFQDIKVSEDLNVEFKDAHRNNNEYIAGMLDCCLCVYSYNFLWHQTLDILVFFCTFYLLYVLLKPSLLK